MDLEHLEKLLIIGRRYGVKNLCVDKIAIEFYLKSQATAHPMPAGEPLTSEEIPTEDELLYWSSGTDIDVKAKPPENM